MQEARKVLGRPFLPVPQGQSVYFNILKLLSEGLEKLTSEEILSLEASSFCVAILLHRGLQSQRHKVLVAEGCH